MRRLFGLLLSLAAVVVTGCATVSRVPCEGSVCAEDGLTPVETVEISNTCWFFLACLPIAGGDVDDPNGWTCSPFSDTATLENQMKMLQAEAERVGAKKAVDVTTLTTDEDVFLFVFLRDKIHTSALLLK